MRKILFMAFLPAYLILWGCGTSPEKSELEIEIIDIDGIPHIRNPAVPLKGEVSLNLEMRLEIDPYEQEEIGFKIFDQVKDPYDGEIILIDRMGVEVHRFKNDGDYNGRLFTEGQGPGEFAGHTPLQVHFIDGQIWISGMGKLAKYDKSGRFLEEFKTNISEFIYFIGNDRFVTSKTEWLKNSFDSLRKVILQRITANNIYQEDMVLMEGMNMGLLRAPDRHGGIAFPWAVPNLYFAVDDMHKKIFIGRSDKYEIEIRDTHRNLIRVVENAMERIPLSRSDKKEWLGEDLLERMPWALNKIPDHLMAFWQIKVFPHGWMAVIRNTSPVDIEMDIYDPDGRYIYLLKPDTTKEAARLVGAKYYEFGIVVVEIRDEIPIYVEYNVTNLNDIFHSQ